MPYIAHLLAFFDANVTSHHTRNQDSSNWRHMRGSTAIHQSFEALYCVSLTLRSDSEATPSPIYVAKRLAQMSLRNQFRSYVTRNTYGSISFLFYAGGGLGFVLVVGFMSGFRPWSMSVILPAEKFQSRLQRSVDSINLSGYLIWIRVKSHGSV